MLPKGPKNHLANFFNLTGNSRLQWFEKLYDKYGDTVRVKIMHQEIIVTRDPAIASEILQKPQEFRKTALAYQVINEIGKGGLFTSDYEKWKIRRPILQPFFTKVHQKLYFDEMQEIISRRLDHREQSSMGKSIDTADLMGEITVDIALGIFFGYRASDSIVQELLYFSNKLSEVSAIRAKLPLIPSSFPLPFNVEFNRYFKQAQEICRFIISERKKKSLDNSPDMLGGLLKIHEESPDFLSEQMIVHEMITFILAGALTTSHALCWISHELLAYPMVASNLKQLISSQIGQQPFTQDWLADCTPIQHIIKESLRLYPSIPIIPRGVNQPNTQLGPYTLPKWTEILIDLHGINRHPSNFQHRNEFIPERHENPTFKTFEYMPWGGGIRKCIGLSFSIIEASSILTQLLQRFDLQLAADANISPTFDVTYYPKGMNIILSRKEAQPQST